MVSVELVCGEHAGDIANGSLEEGDGVGGVGFGEVNVDGEVDGLLEEVFQAHDFHRVHPVHNRRACALCGC